MIFISALAKETAAEVVKNREEWMKYLTTAEIIQVSVQEQLFNLCTKTGRNSVCFHKLWNEAYALLGKQRCKRYRTFGRG